MPGSAVPDPLTVSDSDPATESKPSIARRADIGALSDPNLRGKLLPKATPLDPADARECGPAPSRRTESPISLDDVLRCDAPAAVDNRQAGNNRQAASPRQTGAVANETWRSLPKRKPKHVPSKWVWIGIGAAMLVGVVLLIVVMRMH
jgi:hypothetical protein